MILPAEAIMLNIDLPFASDPKILLAAERMKR